MESKTIKLFTLVLLVAAITATIIIVNPTRDHVSTARQVTSSDERTYADVIKQYAEMKSQRNQLSVELNSLQEKHQQLVCKVKEHSETAESGGWCNRGVETGHATDSNLAKCLEELLLNKTVIGLGDGLGKYRRMLLDAGAVKQYDAFDGAPYIHNITDGQVNFLDLTLPQYWLPVYDFVIILEVLEHIPAQYEDIALDNVARAAGSGVILSWAIPGQGGFHHINCQTPEHVRTVMKLRGFTEDTVWSLKLRQGSSLGWLKQNIMVFRR